MHMHVYTLSLLWQPSLLCLAIVGYLRIVASLLLHVALDFYAVYGAIYVQDLCLLSLLLWLPTASVTCLVFFIHT